MEFSFFKKNQFYDKKIINLSYLIKLNVYKKIVLFNKNSNINILFRQKNIYVYKGNNFKKIHITKYHIGLKLINFLFFKKPFNYPIKKKGRNFLKR